ncbi:MAG: protease HtpX [Gracilibacteraceae bacterium]|nr:protease HtpX [Gracilibacteraceae bacterium]
MKRVSLLILTNFAIMAILLVVCMLLGVDKYLTEAGLNLPMLLIFSAILGFGGSLISLLLSKTMAKSAMKVHIIDRPTNETEEFLYQTISKLAQEARIGMPEVGIYEGEANAFATGARRDAALVAVSTGLLRSMNKDEVEAVLGHEIAHVANGDMITLTLIQGVLNTFVFFLARVLGFVVDKIVFRNERGTGIAYYITVIAAQLVLGILASVIVAYFSRRREYRADAGSAKYLGQPNTMISALQRLGNMKTEALPDSMKASGIAGGKLSFLFSTHPRLEARIDALKNFRG